MICDLRIMHGECSVLLLQGDDNYLAGGVLGHDANAIVATLVLSQLPRTICDDEIVT